MSVKASSEKIVIASLFKWTGKVNNELQDKFVSNMKFKGVITFGAKFSGNSECPKCAIDAFVYNQVRIHDGD